MSQKVVLITGASSGIGKAAAKQLLSEGYKVYASARRLERMEDLRAMGAGVLRIDVTDNESMENGVKKILEETQRIDILINNAGYGSYGALEDVDIKEARYQFEVNVFGLARMTQLVLPNMRNNKFGKILNVTSIGGKIYEPLGDWYHATKFAVEGLSDCLRLELAGFGINVIIIEPGPILTEWGSIAIENLKKVSGNTVYADLAEAESKLLSSTNDKRTASKPEEVALTISRAIRAKRPKARYPSGKGARFIVTARKLLSDGMMDKIMHSLIKKLKTKKNA